MKIINLCRHKKGFWEGIIYEDNRGKQCITNGVGQWESSDKRLAGLDIVESINIPRLCGFMERNDTFKPLVCQLQAFSK